MATDAVTPAVLSYIDHGAYPDDDSIISASLDSDRLAHISTALRKEQDVVKDEIRGLSRSTAGDVDTWIAKAKTLQADILRSRETARQIVAQHEHTKTHIAKVSETGRYVQELEHEVTVYGAIAARLQIIKDLKSLLDLAQDSLVSGDVDTGLAQLQEAEEVVSTKELGDAQSGVGLMLRGRIQRLQENLKTNVQERWNRGIHISIEDHKVVINDGLDQVINAARGLGMFDNLVAKLSKDIERAVFRPRLAHVKNGKVAMIAINEKQLSCQEVSDDISTETLLQDLHRSFGFFAEHLERDIALPLSELLVPRILIHLEDDWLDPAVPVDIQELPEFQTLLHAASSLADQLDSLQWHGSKLLRDWVQAAPKTWLTKRREAVLGDVRNLVFSGLRERKTVERVETQTVSKEDHAALGGSDGGDDWDSAWDDPDESAASPTIVRPAQSVDDEDMSAWDEDGEETSQAPAESQSAAPISTAESQPSQDGDDEDAAWGWDGEDEPQVPNSPKAANPTALSDVKTPSKPAEREITLRETFTVTGIPDAILAHLRQTIADAQALAGPAYASSPLAPASGGLYTLPTQGLALYRATAPTAYAKVDTGNMLVYNDATRLAEQLRAWEAEVPTRSRLKLDHDVKALEQFAKSAYSNEMESQRTILRDLLDGAQGFSSCSEQPAKQECEDAVEQTMLRVRDVHRLWQPVLSTSALLQSIGNLVLSVAQKIIREVEDLPDIGSADSEQLKVLIDKTSQIKDLFLQGDRDMTFVYVPNWFKLQYLREIMVSSLADIKYMWNESELSQEFEAEEVVGLIEALFAESIHRRQAIQEIRRAGR